MTDSSLGDSQAEGPEEDQLTVQIGLVAHWAFCPRRAWLEVMGERTDTAQVQAGLDAHRAVDDPTSSRADRIVAMPIRHSGWGVNGRADALISSPAGWIVREFKATPVRRRPEVTEPLKIQLALQIACLQDMGEHVAGAEVSFVSHHQVVPVDISPDDLVTARAAVVETRRVITAPMAPLPLIDDPRCARCSHAEVCLPDERDLGPVRRQIRVSDPDAQVVYLATPGSRASVTRGRMVVRKGEDDLGSVPLERVQAVQVHGNVDLSAALIRDLLWRGLVITWCTGGGRLVGWAQSGSGPNGTARVRQHVASAEGRLGLGREFVSAKIANQATQLRRAVGDIADVRQLRQLQRSAAVSPSLGELVGLEGQAASLYFRHWPELLGDNVSEWPWHGRFGRGSTDPVNVMLNFAYAMLLSDAIKALVSCGLDPHAGFLHSSGRNKPALALDLMEEFRAPVADSVVLRMIKTGQVRPAHLRGPAGVGRLNAEARKAMIAAYEHRMRTEFVHPTFAYSVTWRRAMEIQARLVLGVLDGSQPDYRGIRTR